MEWMFLPLKRYAEFSGRSRRMEFWMWVLFQFLLGCAFLVGIFSLAGSAFASGNAEQALASGGTAFVIILAWGLVSLAFFIPNLAVTVRRLHDSDRSGWWIMLYWGPALANVFMSRSMVTSSGDNMEALAGASVAISAGSLIGSLVLLVFLFLEGTPGANRFGLDPKGRAGTMDVFA